jgi:hypothetical protein
MIDFARTEEAQRRLVRRLDDGTAASAEQIVIDHLERQELWRIVAYLVLNEQEYIILVESFVLHLPPRLIQSRHPERFADVWLIYQAKRNLLNRLQRNPDLRRLYLSATTSVAATELDTSGEPQYEADELCFKADQEKTR